ncbi:hypothetical protein [Anaerotignum propionicum]|uniref:hypothetical protein n=1 Tax=Anaerotignum propionicum TaxID=28446 RepID=UPI0028997CE9|nr:hypothetical protein [Anaerotignum propionicum]
MLFMLESEVAGELGEETSYQNFSNVRLKGETPIVNKLHFHFSGWLGDELLEATPCFIVTEELAISIKKSNLSGYRFEDVLITVSDEFKEMYVNRELPQFKRFVPTGTIYVEDGTYKEWSGEDICISQKSYLVVSDKALAVLQAHKITSCDITELNMAR